MSYGPDISLDSFSFLCYFMGIMSKKEGKVNIRCYVCGKFISKKQCRATLREPDIFYCHHCYKRELGEEKIAMGYYEDC